MQLSQGSLLKQDRWRGERRYFMSRGFNVFKVFNDAMKTTLEKLGDFMCSRSPRRDLVMRLPEPLG